MKLPPFVPAPHEVVREAFIVIGGALIAAIVISQLPALKQYIKDAWA